MEEKILSIIIPVYQVEKYLVECLDSVVQSMNIHNVVEVILIDDGSTDSSSNICKEYTEKYIYMNYMYKENEGVSATRNFGIKVANGRYITFMDSDDLLHPEFLNEALKKIMKVDFDICFFEYEDLPQKQNNYSNIKSCRKPLFVKEMMTGEEVLQGLINSKIRLSNVWSSVYRRNFLLENEIEFCKEWTSSEDVDFINSCLAVAEVVSFCEATSVIYRRYREGSATNTYDNKKILCDMQVREKWFQYAKKHGMRNYVYYANDFVEFLFLSDVYGQGFDSVLDYIKEKRMIFKESSIKKGKLLSKLILVLGMREGLRVAQIIVDISYRGKVK